MTVVTVAVMTVVIVTYFSKNNWTSQQPMRYSQGSFLQYSQCVMSLKKGKFMSRKQLKSRISLEAMAVEGFLCAG